MGLMKYRYGGYPAYMELRPIPGKKKIFTRKDQMDLFQDEPVKAMPGKRDWTEIDYERSGVQWNITQYKCERATICYFQTLAHRATPLLMYGVSNDNKCLYLINNITNK